MSEDIQAAEDARRAKQAENNAKAAEVMEKSKPVPSQEENDLAKLGVPVEIADPGNPEMPPLHEQTAPPEPPPTGEGGVTRSGAKPPQQQPRPAPAPTTPKPATS